MDMFGFSSMLDEPENLIEEDLDGYDKRRTREIVPTLFTTFLTFLVRGGAEQVIFR